MYPIYSLMSVRSLSAVLVSEIDLVRECVVGDALTKLTGAALLYVQLR
jgi:hypothetical protein